MEYKANFLWGFGDGSIEALGYEFANAKTEEYQKECWEALQEAIKKSCNTVSDNESNCPHKWADITVDWWKTTAKCKCGQ